MIRIADILVRTLAAAAAFAAVMTPNAAIGQDGLLGGAAAEPSLAQNDILRVAISMGGDTSVSEVLDLGLGKSAIVELPIDVADALVSNPAIADAIIRTPRRIYVLGLTVGQTNAFFFNSAGAQILNLEIRVERDLAPVRDMIERLIPNGRITVQALNDSIVLSGVVSSAAESERAQQIAMRYVDAPEKVLNALSISGGEQVLLKVRIVEMQRTIVKQLGINLNGTTQFGEFAPPAIDNNGELTNFAGTGVIETDNQFSLAGRSLGGLFGGIGYDNYSNGILQSSIEATLNALERVGPAASFRSRSAATPRATSASSTSRSASGFRSRR
jgi:pilus assembly protein CpaC